MFFNLKTDWNDGWLLLKLLHILGVHVDKFPDQIDRKNKELNCQLAIEECKNQKIEVYVTSKELAEGETESIGLMIIVANIRNLKSLKKKKEKKNMSVFLNEEEIRNKIEIYLERPNTCVNEPVELCVDPVRSGKGSVQIKARLISNEKHHEKDELMFSVEERDRKFYASLLFNKIGEWLVHVYFDDCELNDSPLKLNVFDSYEVEIIGFKKHVNYMELYCNRRLILFQSNKY